MFATPPRPSNVRTESWRLYGVALQKLFRAEQRELVLGNSECGLSKAELCGTSNNVLGHVGQPLLYANVGVNFSTRCECKVLARLRSAETLLEQIQFTRLPSKLIRRLSLCLLSITCYLSSRRAPWPCST